MGLTKETQKGKALEVIDVLNKYYDVDILNSEQLKSRLPEFLRPRQISMYFIKKLLKGSDRSIGNIYEGKDSATVLHSCNVIRGFIQVDFLIREECKELEIELYEKIRLKDDLKSLAINDINKKLSLFSADKLLKIQKILSNEG